MANLSNINNKFLVTTGGNVGINVTSPGAKLDVDGDVYVRNGHALYLDTLAGYSSAVVSLNASTNFIVPSGSVGIGTASPDSKLDVKGASATPADGNQILSITNTTGGTQLNLGTAENSYGWIEAREGATLRNLLLNPNGGNVGIGTTSPNQSNLVVSPSAQSATVEGITVVYNPDGATNRVRAQLKILNFEGLLELTNSSDVISTYLTAAGNSYFNGGNVGIGTTNPSDGNLVVKKDGVNTGITNVLMNASFSEGGGVLKGLSIGYRTDETTAVLAPRTATGNLAFYSYDGGWSESMRIKNDGNVGIGTSTPSEKLHIASSAASNLVAKIEQDNASYESWFEANSQNGRFFRAGISTNANNFAFFNTDQASYRWFGAGGGSPMTLTNGRLGIGTTSPQRPLHVNGTEGVARFTSTASGNNGFEVGIGTASQAFLWQSESQFMQFATSNTERMRIEAAGNVGIGTTSPTAKLDIRTDDGVLIKGASGSTNGKLSFLPASGGRQYDFRNAGSSFVIHDASAGTDRMYFHYNGNVGIGTTSPDGNLEVVGTTVISTVTDGVNAVLIGLAGSNRTTIQFDTADTTHTNRQWGLTNIAGDFYIGRHGLNVMKMNNNGNVGIGTTSNINAPLTVQADGSAGTINLIGRSNGVYDESIISFYENDGTTRKGYILNSAGNMYFATGGSSENMVIDSSGNVGIGTTTTVSAAKLVVSGQTMVLQDSSGSVLRFQKTLGTNVAFVANRSYGFHDGNGLAIATTDSNPLRFATNDTERMRITSGGTTEFKKNVDILTAQNTNILKVRSTSGSFTSSILLVDCDRTSTNNTYNLANFTNAGTAKCVITDGGDLKNTNNSYGALSDERLKENIIDATPKLDDLMKVKIKTFNLKGDEQKQIGVVAQELEEVFPGMVSSAKTPDSEDETLYKSVKYSVFVPMLIKAIQELKADNDILKFKIETLENK